MERKTPVTLSEELRRREEDLRDLEIINTRADSLNEEAEDALDYQVQDEPGE